MGNKGAKGKLPQKKPAKLDSKDIKFLSKQTGMSKQDIEAFFVKFSENNPDGVLDKKEFVQLYEQLRSEPRDKIDEIAVHIFDAFDQDTNGTINFTEFLVLLLLL